MANIEFLRQYLESEKIQHHNNELMSKHTSFKIGGAAEIFAEPKNEDDLIKIIQKANELDVKITVIGNGSNLLVSDDGIKGIVVYIGKNFDEIKLVGETKIVCFAGVMLKRLCSFALENSLTGLEFAYGIPGSAGGAAFMNAGAYGGEMKDVLTACKHITDNGEFGRFEKEKLELSYRHSVYNENNFIITELELDLEKGSKEEISKKHSELMGKRKSKQPIEYPSAGSVFKRPDGHYAGTLIEQCGLKGKKIGGAMVSEKHAGFIINVGGATCSDVLELVEYIQKTVFENKGVELEAEIKMIGG